MPSEPWLLPRWFKQDGINGVVLEAFEKALTQLGDERLFPMLSLLRATGSGLDLHGRLYGVQRLENELDPSYRNRILAEVRSPRSSKPAILKALSIAFPGKRFDLRSTYETVKLEGVNYFDSSFNFDGSQSFVDLPVGAETISAAFIVDVLDNDVELRLVDAVVERVRAAGYIGTIRQTFTYDFRGGLEPSGAFLDLQAAVFFDSSRNFDGTFNFDGGADPVRGEVGFTGATTAPSSLTALRNRLYGDTNLRVYRQEYLEFTYVLNGSSLTNQKINEVGIFDTANNLVGYALFPAKTLTVGTQLVFKFLY